jgi:hypothetical protein
LDSDPVYNGSGMTASPAPYEKAPHVGFRVRPSARRQARPVFPNKRTSSLTPGMSQTGRYCCKSQRAGKVRFFPGRRGDLLKSTWGSTQTAPQTNRDFRSGATTPFDSVFPSRRLSRFCRTQFFECLQQNRPVAAPGETAPMSAPGRSRHAQTGPTSAAGEQTCGSSRLARFRPICDMRHEYMMQRKMLSSGGGVTLVATRPRRKPLLDHLVGAQQN